MEGFKPWRETEGTTTNSVASQPETVGFPVWRDTEQQSSKPSLSFMQQLAKAGTSSMPGIGAILGGILGTPLGLPGMVGGSALGAGIGASGQKLIEQPTGLSEQETITQQYSDIGKEMLYGGLSPAGGQVGAKTTLGVLGNKLSPTMQGVNAVAKEAGVVPSISMLRPESKAAAIYDNIIGKLPLATLLQRSNVNKIINKTGEFAEQTKDDLFETSVKAGRAKQGLLYQQGLDAIPTDRLPMPKTVEYVQRLLKTENISDAITAVKNNPDLAGLNPEVMDEILKSVAKNTQPKTLSPQATAALEGFLSSVDEAGGVSKEMLGTFKANLGKSKVGQVIQKELNRLMRSEMPEEASKLWQQADEGYSYLSKLKPVEDIFKFSFSNKQGFKEFNPATYVQKYEQALSDEIIPKQFQPVMDKLKVLAELSTKSKKMKAEFSSVTDIVANVIGVSGVTGTALGAGTVPAVAITGSALMLAKSSTAKRGIIRKLATSGVMSKQASEVLGELAGKYGTMELASD